MKVYIISEKNDLYNSVRISSDIDKISNEDYCFLSFHADLNVVKQKCTFIQTDNLFCLEDESAKHLLYSLLTEEGMVLINL
ncbi:MAG: hypothetical protein II291_06390 [Succinivibrio sp.]|nr:hypothetical protein [Succinivibrio sp.]